MSPVWARSASRRPTPSSSCFCSWAATSYVDVAVAAFLGQRPASHLPGLPCGAQHLQAAPRRCRCPAGCRTHRQSHTNGILADLLLHFHACLKHVHCRARFHSPSTLRSTEYPSSTRRIGSEQMPSDIRCASLPGLRVRCGVLVGYMPTPTAHCHQRLPWQPFAGPPPRPEQTLFLPSVTEEGLHPNNHPHCFLDRVQATVSHRETRHDDTLLRRRHANRTYAHSLLKLSTTNPPRRTPRSDTSRGTQTRCIHSACGIALWRPACQT